VKAQRGTILRSVGEPDRAIRFYLFHGPDDSGSRALAERLRAALDAEKCAVASGAVKADPAMLAAEAGAISLFGGARLVWVDPAGDEITEGVEALLDASAVESPVVAIAGTLRKSSALLRLAEAHGAALAHASYAPEGRDAARMVIDAALAEGLNVDSGVAARVAANAARVAGVDIAAGRAGGELFRNILKRCEQGLQRRLALLHQVQHRPPRRAGSKARQAGQGLG